MTPGSPRSCSPACRAGSSTLLLVFTTLLLGCGQKTTGESTAPRQSTSLQHAGFETPGALVEHLNSLIESPESVKEKLLAVHALSLADSPEARRGFKVQIEFVTAFQNLMQAASATFGNDSSPTLSMMKTQIDNSISKMHLDSLKMTSGTSAEITVDQAMGTPITQYLVKTRRGWLINEDENYARTPELVDGLDILPIYIDAFNSVAEQIKAGGISDPANIDMALGQAIQAHSGAGSP